MLRGQLGDLLVEPVNRFQGDPQQIDEWAKAIHQRSELASGP